LPQTKKKGIPYLQTNNEDKFEMFDKRGLRFMHVNINSILLRIEELRYIASASKISVIGISESKADSPITNEEISNPGYHILRKDRNRNGGGVLAYIKESLSYNLRDDFDSQNESIFFEIFLPRSRPILIGIAYRPPNDSDFIKILHESILSLNDFNRWEVYIMGDLNINMDNKNPSNNLKHEYIDFCHNVGLCQIIKSYTHISKNSSSIIDHILTNSKDRISQFGVIETSFSDHFSVFFTRKIERKKLNKHREINVRSFKNYNKEFFLNKLRDINRLKNDHDIDLDECYENFVIQISKIFDEVAPFRKIRVKNNTAEWFDDEILQKIITRDKLHRKYKISRLEGDGIQFRLARNKVHTLVNKKKENFIKNSITKNKQDSKKLWKAIKTLGLPSKAKINSKINLKVNEKLISNPLDIADHFNETFSKIADNLVGKLPKQTKKYSDETTAKYYESKRLRENNFSFQSIDESIITDILENLDESKAAGFDNIPGTLLKDGSEILSKPISDILNLSIKLSKFPEKCKIAKIKPIYKKGSKVEATNYRPISLLPLISKVFERVIHNQLQAYIKSYNILYKFLV